MFACDARMDGDIAEQAPWTSELHVAATALAGLAWLTLVLGLRWRLRTKAVPALPGLATLATAVVVAVAIGGAARGTGDSYLPMMLLLRLPLLRWSRSPHGNQTFTVAVSYVWWWCCRVRRLLVPSTRSRSMWP